MNNEFDPNEEVDIPEIEGFEVPDPESVITIRTSGGQTAYVPTSEPMTVADIILSASLTVNSSFQVWLNGAQITTTDLVPTGSTLTIVGSVKGGTR